MYQQTILHGLPLEKLIPEWDRLEKSRPNKLDAIRALCLADLYYLLVRVCGRKDMLHPWVYARCREFEADPDGYLDLWAREHHKSSIITFGGSLQAILRDPEITIGFFSENYTLAQKFLLQIKRELEENKTLIQAFPEILYENPKADAQVWSGDAIIVKRKGNPKEPTVECQGLISMKTGAHYQLMVYDDVITAESVTSPERVESVNSKFELSLSQSREGGKKRFIGTRYSHNDTYQLMIEREIAIPRIYEATDDGTPEGTPVLFSHEYWLEKKRENSQFNLSCQYLQNPQAAGEKVFDVTRIQSYEIRPSIMNAYLVCDPAKSQKKGACNTAMLLIGVAGNNKYYLLDGACHKMTLSERWEMMKFLYYKWFQDNGIARIKVGYETYGGGSTDVEYFLLEMNKGNSPRFDIEPLTSSKTNSPSHKKDRIERMQPDVYSRNIFVPYHYSLRSNLASDEHRQTLFKYGHGLTGIQSRTEAEGNGWRVAKPIKRKDENKQLYDLTEVFLKELDAYPFGKLVDCIDAFSRIYDMDPKPVSGSSYSSNRRRSGTVIPTPSQLT